MATHEHQWVEFRMTPVIRITDPTTGEHAFIEDPNPEAQPDLTYGCVVCDMGESEASTNDCPGFDLFKEPEPNG